MINQEIINYIRAELTSGVSKEEISNSLVSAGWGIKDIQDSFDSISTPLSSPVAHSEVNNTIINEKDYPIQELWVLKSVLGSLLGLIVIILLFSSFLYSNSEGEFKLKFYIVITVIFSIYRFIVVVLERATFRYSTEKQFLVLRQGIISKQERHIPYGVIQNLFVKQDILDRIFGLASLTIENAAQGAGSRVVVEQRKQVEMAGFSKNKVSIPGLTKKDAEALKEIVLQKMKENPIEDSQSGL